MELKVRFWDIDGGKMSAGINFEQFVSGDADLQFPDMEETLPYKDFACFRKEFSEPMLFTGLHDKNGKEMYESDKFKRGDDIGRIWFKDGCFTFQCHTYSMTMRDHNENEFEIIGHYL